MSRFDYVAYDDTATKQQAEIKAAVQHVESLLEKNIKCGRSKAAAINALEVTYMWTGKGIRNDQLDRNKETKLQESRGNE